MKLLKIVLTSFIVLVGREGYIRAQSTKSSPMSALSLLTIREPKVMWNTGVLLKADFVYDGVDNYAVSGRTGARYVVGIVKGTVNGRLSHWTLGFSADPGDQGSLCSESTARIEVEPLDEEQVEGASKLPRNSRGINLSDGACDSFHIFWARKPRRFVWWRL